MPLCAEVAVWEGAGAGPRGESRATLTRRPSSATRTGELLSYLSVGVRRRPLIVGRRVLFFLLQD